MQVIFLKAFDIAPGKLVQATAIEFEKQGIEKPDWVLFVKTGSHTERAPSQHNWWHQRLASVLYRVYKDGPVGTQRLRSYYGGRKSRGVQPHVFRRAGGKIIRVCLRELEKLGFVQKNKAGGRIVSAKGQAFLDKMAKETIKIVEEEKRHFAELKAAKEIGRAKRDAEEKRIREELRKIGGAPKQQKIEKKTKKKKAKGEANETG